MIRFLLLLFFVTIAALSFVAGSRYAGHWAVYLAFSIAANTLLLAGFRTRALYFDTFIGIFLWLGFWLKLSIRVAFSGGIFAEPVGAFDGSPEAFDSVLLVATASFAALLLASFVRERFFVYPLDIRGGSESALFHFYSRFRGYIVTAFLLTVLLMAVSNVWFEIYQRGMIAQTVLPFGLNGVYKWALQFGLASVAALIVRFELELGRNLTPLAIVVPILESFLSNTAMLSRGMVLNSSAIALGGLRTMLSQKLRIVPARLAVAAALFCALFAVSVLLVNFIRIANFNPGADGLQSQTAEVTQSMTAPLFVDRWIGIEGLMAVSSSKIQGWDLWNLAWQEKFQEGKQSLYDAQFIASPYHELGIEKPRNHFVSLPGIVAFLYYPGSLLFLCAALVAAAWVAAFLEILTYLCCGRNLVLCALFAQVVAFRFASFGYVPAQSYLLFGSLALNGALIFVAERGARAMCRSGV